MDKRTFLFVIALSLSLFALNIFFQSHNDQKRQEWLDRQKQVEAKKQNKREADVLQRIAPSSSLPIASAYADEQENSFLTAGVLINDQFLALSWQDKLPEELFIKAESSSEPKRFRLAHQEPGLRTPVLYQANPNVRLATGSLSETGQYDLQLVDLNPLNALNPFHVLLGDYQDGHFSIPLKDKQAIETDPASFAYNGIALLKTNKGYLPVGFYKTQDQAFSSIRQMEKLAAFAQPIVEDKAHFSQGTQKPKEEFYVLENDYQQLVFSNYGGALAEINLPFKSKENTKSVVREIEFDRQMIKHHSRNALFPSHGYYTPSVDPENPLSFEKHENGRLGGYYPLLRRDLIEPAKDASVDVKPQYYALNTVSEFQEVSNLVYQVKAFTKNSIVLEAVQPHRRITKTFYLSERDQGAPYCLTLDIKVEGDSKGLWLTSGIPEVEWISGAPAPAIKYRITRNQKVEFETIELPKDTASATSVYPDWICNSNGFLGTILDPLTDIDPGYRVQYVSGNVVPSRLVAIDQEFSRYKAASLPGYTTLLPLKSQGGKMTFRLFAGPFDGDILKTVDKIYSDPETGYNPDYIGCQTMHGWFTFISEPFAKFLLVLLKLFHSFTGSWALSIVLLTVCLRVILYPLNAWSTRSMIKMQQIAPEVSAIQDKYKKDPKKAQVEVMTLYRERGVNPVSGCLPLLIQMPFLIGMFDLLKSSFALRGAPFIPGWIDDLTAPDVLFSWKYPLFFIGNEFHLLPILLGLVMFIQQRFFSNSPTDPALMTDQQRQQKVMGTMMTFVFAIMFYNFPSGLNIYWLSSMILGMLQQWYMTKKMNHQLTIAPVVQKGKSKKTAR